ncbi:MAG: DNA integrity scanning protein DisA nucleotide-binding domain protein [Parcubacteria group bacterium]|nr:DNA integrity scanning protein DisA nucleotide-binding domain protein [Parcubacteria group bacterium]
MFVEGIRTKIKNVLKEESIQKSHDDKMRLLELILKLASRRKKMFGLFVIFGWEEVWNDQYAVFPDSSQDLFSTTKQSIFDEKSLKKISATVDFDGAILVDHKGLILHSGVILEGLRPSKLPGAVASSQMKGDFSACLGFKKKVHARHMAAITSSYELKGTTVYTVSEETGDVHMFEEGRIVFSTVEGEVKRSS